LKERGETFSLILSRALEVASDTFFIMEEKEDMERLEERVGKDFFLSLIVPEPPTSLMKQAKVSRSSGLKNE